MFTIRYPNDRPNYEAELITKILSRLPVKSLLEFTSVSKARLALISSPELINIHLSLSANNKEDTNHMLTVNYRGAYKRNFKEFPVRSLFFDSVTEAFDLDCPIEYDRKYVGIEGSCNGLILLADSEGYSFLWNPSTRKYKTLPYFTSRWKTNLVKYGFGYDELHDDYKVVGVSYKFIMRPNDISDDTEVKIYSLKSDSWTNVDYSNEKWEKVDKPSYGVGETELHVGKLGSDLCVFTDYKGSHLCVWVMSEYGIKESWIKKFTIRYPDNRKLYPPPFVMQNKSEILRAFRSTFMIYNSRNDSFKFPDIINFDGCLGAEIYIESLVCPFSSERTEETTNERPTRLRSKQLSNI
ncbi:F-box protein CPR1-like [Capsicum galapagoense]